MQSFDWSEEKRDEFGISIGNILFNLIVDSHINIYTIQTIQM